jgi:signal transduction histidine kinase
MRPRIACIAVASVGSIGLSRLRSHRWNDRSAADHALYENGRGIWTAAYDASGGRLQRTEWLLARPWSLVIVVALLIVVPILALGELSAADARARNRASELASLSATADRAALSLTDAIEVVRRQVAISATTPVSGVPTTLLRALQSSEKAAIDQVLADIHALLGSTVPHLTLLDSEGRVLAESPPVRSIVSTPSQAQRPYFAQLSVAAPTYLSRPYITQSPPAFGIFQAGISVGTNFLSMSVSSLILDSTKTRFGVLVADIDLRLVARAVTPLLAAADDLYVFDEGARLVLRATHAFTPDPEALVNLRTRPIVASAFETTASRAEGDDPLGGGPRLVGIARLADLGWRVLALRKSAAIDPELDASLAAGQRLRFALAAVLLLGSALFAHGAGDLWRQRRALRESLEQQTATSELLSLVSRPRLDLQPVLEVVLDQARVLCDAEHSWVRLDTNGSRNLLYRGPFDLGPYKAQLKGAESSTPPERSLAGRIFAERRIIHSADVPNDPAVSESNFALLIGARAALGVPLMNGDDVIGGFILGRNEPRPFTQRQIDIAKTLADQATIAVANVALYRDIDEKSRQLETANRHKSEFLANMSHELRTPLNAIIGFSSVLLERMAGDLNRKQAEYVSDILDSGKHQLSLINDILDLAKVEAGRMELVVGDVSLAEVCGTALTLVRDQAIRRDIHLDLVIDPTVPTIWADKRKVLQVILNLLANAVKFSPDGGAVELRVRRGDGAVEISVRDAGHGISPTDHERIFDEFTQARGAAAKSSEGTGLGLAVSRKLVQLHGGRIWVESAVGSGSTFTFTLPSVTVQATSRSN